MIPQEKVLNLNWGSHSNPAMLSEIRWISHCESFGIEFVLIDSEEDRRVNRWDKNVR
jgi:hypothetical protein